MVENALINNDVEGAKYMLAELKAKDAGLAASTLLKARFDRALYPLRVLLRSDLHATALFGIDGSKFPS